jgi:hypothetical protein
MVISMLYVLRHLKVVLLSRVAMVISMLYVLRHLKVVVRTFQGCKYVRVHMRALVSRSL